MQLPVATSPSTVNKMKWLISARVNAPMMIGERVEEVVPKTASTPPEMFLTRVGQSSVWQMAMSANYIEIAKRKMKTRASWMKMVAQRSHPVGLEMKVRAKEITVAVPKSTVAHVLLLTLSMMSMSGQQVSRSETLSTVSEVYMSKPNWLTISVGPQYIRKVAMLMSPCAMVMVLRELQRKTSSGVEALLYLMVYWHFITFQMSSIFTRSLSFLFIHPISFISLSAFSGLSTIRYIGDSLRQRQMTTALMKAGMVRQQIDVIFQSSNKQQKRVTSNAPSVKVPCTIDITFCLKLSSRHSAALEPRVPRFESEPMPHKMSAIEAIHRFWEKMRRMQPRKVVLLEMRKVILLPKLSATMAMKKQPIMVPRQGALEQRLRQTSSSQQQCPNQLARDLKLLASAVTKEAHRSEGKLHTQVQQSSVSRPKASQSNSGLLKMKEVLMRTMPVTQQEKAQTKAKMYWYFPLPPTFRIKSRYVSGRLVLFLSLSVQFINSKLFNNNKDTIFLSKIQWPTALLPCISRVCCGKI